MLPRKTGKPIAFKCTEELRQQTEAIADSLGESLSDYVRKAVEQRNAQHKKPRETMEYKGTTFELFEPPEHKNNTVSNVNVNSNMVLSEMKPENIQVFVDKINKQQEHPEYKPAFDATEKPKKSKMVQPFMKGGK